MQKNNDSENGFKKINPAPFNRAFETQDRQSNTTKISLKMINITLGLTVMLISLVIVIFFLPTWVENNNVTDTSDNTLVDAISKLSITDSRKIPTTSRKPLVEKLPPEEQARNIALRKQAQNYLQEILGKQRSLEENNAELWAGERFMGGINHVSTGDELYKKKYFAEANEAYQQALDSFNPLYEKIKTVYQENIARGINALDTGDFILALAAFKTASLFIDESGQAALGLERTQKLNEVFFHIEQGNEMLNEGHLIDAKAAYQTALEIDPDTKIAQRKLKKTNLLIAEKRFNTFMSAGYAALDQQDFTNALKQFNNALRIKPNASAGKTALQQTRYQATTIDIAYTLKKAAISETNEQWQTAIDLYSNALKLEKNLAEAQSGKLRAQQNLVINQRLDKILSRPERLSDERIHEEANAYYNKISQLDKQGPILTNQLSELENLLQVSATPVKIQLQSDNLTDVIVYKVGKMGLFETRELSLRPGKYVVVGRRAGYRDVRIEFYVSHDTSKQTVRITAKDEVK
jgi:tetratricopeptide (TPR) repeat protein